MQLSDSGFLPLGHMTLEYRMIGPRPDQGPALVLLHEGLGSVTTWKDFPDQLAATTGCGVFVYSRRGYGRSSPYPAPWPLTYMHDEGQEILPALLDAIGFEQGVLVGHSDGASIAAIYAGAHHDDRLKGLVLMAPHFFTEDSGLTHIRLAAQAFAEGGLRQRLLVHHGGNVDDAFWGWNKAWLDPGFRQWNLEHYIPKIRVPVLLIQGEDDQYGTAAQLDAVSRACPAEVTTRWLADCTHFPHREQPRATLAATAAFVSRLLAL